MVSLLQGFKLVWELISLNETKIIYIKLDEKKKNNKYCSQKRILSFFKSIIPQLLIQLFI